MFEDSKKKIKEIRIVKEDKNFQVKMIKFVIPDEFVAPKELV